MSPEALAKGDGNIFILVEAMGGLWPYENMYFVYILKLANGKIYTGSTPDIKKRVEQHQRGYVLSTKNFRPIKLIWYCSFANRLQARRFELYLKTGSGQAFRNKHLK